MIAGVGFFNHLATPQGIVDHHEAIRAEFFLEHAKIFRIIFLVGIKKDQVKLLVQLRDDCECIPPVACNGVLQSRFAEIAIGNIRHFLVLIDGVNMAVRGKPFSEAYGRVAGVGAYLEDVLWP